MTEIREIREKLLSANKKINIDLDEMDLILNSLEHSRYNHKEKCARLENWCRNLLTDIATTYCETIMFCENVKNGIDKTE